VDEVPDSTAFLEFLRAAGVDYVLLGAVYAADVRRIGRALEVNCRSVRVRKAVPPYAYVWALGDGPSDMDPCTAIADYYAALRERDYSPRGWQRP
jgi:hypothetical protein